MTDISVTTKHENSGEQAHNGIRHCAIKLHPESSQGRFFQCRRLRQWQRRIAMRVHRNCCGLDVHKQTIAACLISESEDGTSSRQKRTLGP